MGFWVVQTLAMTAAFGKVLNYNPTFTKWGPLLVICIAGAIQAASIATVDLATVALAARFPRSRLAPAAPAVAFASLWTAIGLLSPIGTFGNPAYALPTADGPLTPLLSIGGVPLADFALVLPAAAAATALRQAGVSRRALTAPALVLVATWLAASFMRLRPAFYQRTTGEEDATRSVSCIANADAMGLQEMLDATRTRLCAGDDVVLWSESALTFGTAVGDAGPDWAVNSLLETVTMAPTAAGDDPCARYMLAPVDNGTRGPPIPARPARSPWPSSQTVVAGYVLRDPDTGRARNRVAVLRASRAGTAWRLRVVGAYDKRHPVPGGEAHVDAGSGPVLAVDTGVGRLSPAVCFDLDFPFLAMRMAWAGAAVIAQPARTWAPMGTLHLRDSAARAVETGATLLRCAANGDAAVVSPTHGLLARVHFGDRGVAAFTVRVPTRPAIALFPYGGFLIGPLLIALHALLLLLACTPCRIARVAGRRLLPEPRAAAFLAWIRAAEAASLASGGRRAVETDVCDSDEPVSPPPTLHRLSGRGLACGWPLRKLVAATCDWVRFRRQLERDGFSARLQGDALHARESPEPEV